MALPSHIVAWLSLKARQLRPAQPPQCAGLFLAVAGGNAELRLSIGPPFCCAGCDTGHGATRGVLLNHFYNSGRVCLADLALTICYLYVDRLRA
jgi:hypothetical protein